MWGYYIIRDLPYPPMHVYNKVMPFKYEYKHIKTYQYIPGIYFWKQDIILENHLNPLKRIKRVLNLY